MMDQYDTVFYFKINVGLCDLYVIAQWVLYLISRVVRKTIISQMIVFPQT